MKTRRLGRTHLDVGVIGLGTEYLVGAPRETVVSVVREAVERGVNYFDVLFSYPEYRDSLGAAFQGLRDRILIAGHIGPAETDGQYRKSRDITECEELFHDLLVRLHTDYVDVAVLQFVDEQDDYDAVMGSGGLLELARRFQREGKARFIGMSGHTVPVSQAAVESNRIDVLMHPVNMAGHIERGRADLLRSCAARDVGLVGMKPFKGGDLLRSASPVQCLDYALSQPGVSTVVPGVKNATELQQALHYLDATREERDFSTVLGEVSGTEKGSCTYCNHCLPCPVGINVGETLRLLAIAQQNGTNALGAEYESLREKALECTECGTCMERCPFEVNVTLKMREVASLSQQ